MKMIRSILSVHQAFHQQSLNRLAHAVAVPLMIFGAMIPLSLDGRDGRRRAGDDRDDCHCGEGELVKTVLLPGQAPDGAEIS